jgi:hypothetical protein
MIAVVNRDETTDETARSTCSTGLAILWRMAVLYIFRGCSLAAMVLALPGCSSNGTPVSDDVQREITHNMRTLVGPVPGHAYGWCNWHPGPDDDPSCNLVLVASSSTQARQWERLVYAANQRVAAMAFSDAKRLTLVSVPGYVVAMGSVQVATGDAVGVDPYSWECRNPVLTANLLSGLDVSAAEIAAGGCTFQPSVSGSAADHWYHWKDVLRG